MSGLDRELEAWRTSLEASRTLTRDDVHELETHLREEIDDLRLRGLDDTEALWVALRRTGDPVALAEEYRKVNPGLPWARKWYLMAFGFLVFTAAWQAAGFAVVLGMNVLARIRPETGFLSSSYLVVALAGAVAVAIPVLASASRSRSLIAELPRRALGWLERRPGACLLVCGLPTAYVAVGAYSALVQDFWQHLSFEGALPSGVPFFLLTSQNETTFFVAFGLLPLLLFLWLGRLSRRVHAD